MKLTPKGFKKYDPKEDESVIVEKYIIDDSSYNMDKADELITELETNINANKTELDGKINTNKSELIKMMNDKNTELHNKVDDKFTHDSKRGSNFNFIENKVVPDSLIYSLNNKTVNSKESILTNKKILHNGTINMSFNTTGVNGSFDIISQMISTQLKGWSLRYMESNGRNLYLVVGDGATKVITSTKKLGAGVNYEIVLILKDGNISVLVDNELIIDSKYITEENANIVISKLHTADTYDKYFSISSLIYEDAILSPQEISHNFSVLNNYPSLKSTEITDSEGNKSTLLSIPKLYKESKTLRGTWVEIQYTETRDLVNYNYKFM